jgi:multiple sugar transport system permease protein
MTHALGALAFWAGLFFAVRALWLLARWAVTPRGPASAGLLAPLGWSAAVGGAGLLLGGRLSQPQGLQVPVAFPVMPVPAWLAVVCLGMAGLRLGQGFLGVGPERLARFKSAPLWVVAAAACAYWADAQKEKWEVLTGFVTLTPQAAVGLGLLALGGCVLAAAGARSRRVNSVAKASATQATLLLGSFLFLVPFAWQLVTSFKEDQDMVSPEGIVWVPRVKQTAPHMNPAKPYYRADYNGMAVEANVERKNPDGTLKLTVARPASISGYTFDAKPESLTEIPRQVDVVSGTFQGTEFTGKVVDDLPDGRKTVEFFTPESLRGKRETFARDAVQRVRPVGLRVQNYSEALEFLPPETQNGTLYFRNTFFLVVMNVVGTLFSCSVVAYAFARLRFPGKAFLFTLLLSTMMLPAAVTMLPQFLIFRQLGWVDTLLPLWVPSFFAGAFNVFMLRQFFMQIPFELEDAAKIDGCSVLRTFWSVMVPQVVPALIVIAIWTFLGTWNNFMGPLIYINSPELMPVSYAVQMFNGERSGEPGLLMAFVTMAMLPVLALFALAQKYFIEGVSLSGLGGR